MDILNTVAHMDIFDLCDCLEDDSIDMILCDPPYYGIVADSWDNQWDDLGDYLIWVRDILTGFCRIMKPNGSLYLFASHKLHAQIQMEVMEFFNVLNNIVLINNGATTKRADRSMLRGYLPTTEHCIFAEHKNNSAPFSGELVYVAAEQETKKAVFGDYLLKEFNRANVKNRDIARLFPSLTGNMTGCVSNWLIGHNIPTKTQYEAMRAYLNSSGDDYLRSDYEQLRSDYEQLRRPFFLDIAGKNETNVWHFPPVYSGRLHPTQKPIDVFEHIIKVSSRPGGIIFDPCVGSGTTAIAARNTGRNYIVGDSSAEYVDVARRRLAAPYTMPMFEETTAQEDKPKQQQLFDVKG